MPRRKCSRLTSSADACGLNPYVCSDVSHLDQAGTVSRRELLARVVLGLKARPQVERKQPGFRLCAQSEKSIGAPSFQSRNSSARLNRTETPTRSEIGVCGQCPPPLSRNAHHPPKTTFRENLSKIPCQVAKWLNSFIRKETHLELVPINPIALNC
jgi:hypothetical protein